MRNCEKYYMAISLDKYELPIAIFDNIKEFSEWSNKTKGNCLKYIYRNSVDKKNKCKYIAIIIDKREECYDID